MKIGNGYVSSDNEETRRRSVIMKMMKTRRELECIALLSSSDNGNRNETQNSQGSRMTRTNNLSCGESISFVE